MADFAPSSMSETEIVRLVESCERSAIPRELWTHRLFLVLGTYYAFRYEGFEALDQFRSRLRALNERHGIANSTTSGYHETLTRFWLHMIRDRLLAARLICPNMSLSESVDHTLGVLGGDSRLAHTYWSRSRLHSVNARLFWVEPDLLPLPIRPEPRIRAWQEHQSRFFGHLGPR